MNSNDPPLPLVAALSRFSLTIVAEVYGGAKEPSISGGRRRNSNGALKPVPKCVDNPLPGGVRSLRLAAHRAIEMLQVQADDKPG